MQSEVFEQNYHGDVTVDLCFSCAGIWFDRSESTRLSADAVVKLFKQIYEHRTAPAQPVAKTLACPRCAIPLELGFDLCKSGRFSYFRCKRGDGRFTPFFQFLREKHFVRSLTAAEIQRVRAEVRQINCSGCGAPVDLEQSSQCKYCHAPVSFLDPEAVEKAFRGWSEAASRRPSPEALATALLPAHFPQGEPHVAARVRLGARLLSGLSGLGPVAEGLDLVAIGMQAVGRLFNFDD